ncbi:MAG: Undecaprenyl-phosphate 4-deoxy-4-formamido-L-arabinose transferase [Chloroflexi bacterium ADurb.Bin180]|nr:MAG: Undecaprenyl-phosphate 4-deoxy-4-formamido-L-arabinose transferase [Chloroflexi bacterium ADurb.Bin180]
MTRSITAFFPAYNDGGTIASMVLSVLITLRQLTDDYEVIVIDDGSSDYTPEILDELATIYDRVRVIHHEKNRGYGGALRTGFASATKDLIFYTDGDAQYDARELKLLYPALVDGVDMVNGYKISRSDPWYRTVIGRIYHWTVKLAFGLKLRDVDCDFRLMRREIFDRVTLESDSGVICAEMMKKIQDAGFVIAEVPVHHYHRAYGRSQFFNFRRTFRVGLDLIRLWVKLVLKADKRARAASAPSQ